MFIAFNFGEFKSDRLRIAIVAFLCVVYAVVLKFAGKESFWYNTSLIFPMGMLYACEEKIILEEINRKRWCYISALVLSIVLLVVSLLFTKGIVGLVSAALCFFILILISMKCKLKSEILYRVGSYAFEIFILQRLGFMLSERLFQNQYMFLLGAVLMTIVFLRYIVASMIHI